MRQKGTNKRREGEKATKTNTYPFITTSCTRFHFNIMALLLFNPCHPLIPFLHKNKKLVSKNLQMAMWLSIAIQRWVFYRNSPFLKILYVIYNRELRTQKRPGSHPSELIPYLTLWLGLPNIPFLYWAHLTPSGLYVLPRKHDDDPMWASVVVTLHPKEEITVNTKKVRLNVNMLPNNLDAYFLRLFIQIFSTSKLFS